jgi:hypothetical protein
VYGYYVHPEAGPDGEPVVVRLLANPEDRATCAREGYVYLGEAPAPGTSTPEEEEAALKKAQLEAARKAEPKAEPEAPAVPRATRASA